MNRLITQHSDVGRFKERVRNAREQEILRAARDVFAQQGFDDASIYEELDKPLEARSLRIEHVGFDGVTRAQTWSKGKALLQ